MGGGESLTIGLNHTDLFAWIGTFSAGVNATNATTLTRLPTLTPQKANLHLLWMACGVDDALLKPNQAVIAALKARTCPSQPSKLPATINGPSGATT